MPADQSQVVVVERVGNGRWPCLNSLSYANELLRLSGRALPNTLAAPSRWRLSGPGPLPQPVGSLRRIGERSDRIVSRLTGVAVRRQRGNRSGGVVLNVR